MLNLPDFEQNSTQCGVAM